MEVMPGYKQTEIGVIPEDWEIVLLDSVAKRGSGHTPDKKHPEYWGGQIKWISLQDTHRLDRLYIFDTAATITPAGIANSSATMHSAGTVVLSRDAGVGKSAIMRDDMAVSQHFMAWKCGSSLNNHFLYYWLQSHKSEFERIAMGNTIKTIGLPYFRQLAIPLPPTKAEQEANAEALSDADALIESLEQLIANKRHIKQGAIQELLTGRKRLPGFSGELEVKSLKDVCRAINDGTHFTPQYFESGVPFYSVENVTANDFTNTKFISSREHNQLIKRCRPEKGDILLTRIGAIGDTKLIDWDVEASIYVSLALLKVREDVASRYVYSYTKCRKFIKDIEARSLMNASPKKINMGDIGGVPIVMPPLPEQTAIATILSDMDDEIAALEQKLAKTRQIKQGMMHNLLTGKVRLV